MQRADTHEPIKTDVAGLEHFSAPGFDEYVGAFTLAKKGKFSWGRQRTRARVNQAMQRRRALPASQAYPSSAPTTNPTTMPGTSPTSTTNPSGDDDQADDQLPMPMMEDGAYDD